MWMTVKAGHTTQVVGGCNVRMNIVSLITAQHCNHLSPDGPVDTAGDVVVLCRAVHYASREGFNLIWIICVNK